MRVLELGNYVVPAYAGMILAEQGHAVVKWTNGRDPILSCNRGDELWQWINHGKTILDRHPSEIVRALPDFDVVLDNFRPATLEKWQVDPAKLASEYGVVWVSMRADVGDRSFDLLAQARSWMYFCPWVPFWIGDTVCGLWLAFKALSMREHFEAGHHVLYQAACLGKLVEGELQVTADRSGYGIPWEAEMYRFDEQRQEAVVEYKGQEIREPVRGIDWQIRNLRHVDGRFVI